MPVASGLGGGVAAMSSDDDAHAVAVQRVEDVLLSVSPTSRRRVSS